MENTNKSQGNLLSALIFFIGNMIALVIFYHISRETQETIPSLLTGAFFILAWKFSGFLVYEIKLMVKDLKDFSNEK